MADKCQLDLVVTFFWISVTILFLGKALLCALIIIWLAQVQCLGNLWFHHHYNIPQEYPPKQNLDINEAKMIWQIQSKVFSTSLHHLNVTFLPPLTACQIQCNRYFSDFQFWLFAFFYFENHSGPSWNRETFRVAMPTQWVPILIF